MAPTLELFDSGTGSTHTLTAGGVYNGLRSYFPGAPEITINGPSDPLRNGDLVKSVTRRNVTETAVIRMTGQPAAVSLEVNEMERLIARAEAGVPIYVRYKPHTTYPLYRSRLYTGRVLWPDEPALRHLFNSTIDTQIALIMVRDPWWEDNTLTELSISSSTQTARTGGVIAYNNDDATANTNWVQIDAAQVLGSIPTPAEVRIINDTGSALSWRNIYLTSNAHASPTTYSPFLHGSSASPTGASTSWSSAGSDHGTLRYSWEMSTGQITALDGRYARVLAAFSTMAAGMYVQAHVITTVNGVHIPVLSGNEIYTGDSPFPRELIDLGAFPFPPKKGTATSEIGVALTFRDTNAGNATLDFVALLPAETTRHLSHPSYSTADGVAMAVDNGPEGVVYGGSGRVATIRPSGLPIMLYPNTTQRLYVLFDEASEQFVPGRQFQVRVFARARKLTV